MTEDDEDERRWHSACEAIGVRGDLAALSELLRSDAPIPDSIRWSLAELFSPRMKLWDFRLTARRTDAFRKDQRKRAGDGRVAQAVSLQLRSGKTQEEAFDAVADNGRFGGSDAIKKAWLRACQRFPFWYLRVEPNGAAERYAKLRRSGMAHRAALATLKRELAPKGGRPKGVK